MLPGCGGRSGSDGDSALTEEDVLQPEEDDLVVGRGEVGEAEGEGRAPGEQRERVEHHERRLTRDDGRQEESHLWISPHVWRQRHRAGELTRGHAKHPSPTTGQRPG